MNRGKTFNSRRKEELAGIWRKDEDLATPDPTNYGSQRNKGGNGQGNEMDASLADLSVFFSGTGTCRRRWRRSWMMS